MAEGIIDMQDMDAIFAVTDALAFIGSPSVWS